MIIDEAETVIRKKNLLSIGQRKGTSQGSSVGTESVNKSTPLSMRITSSMEINSNTLWL